jgi:hypothetical protein
MEKIKSYIDHQIAVVLSRFNLPSVFQLQVTGNLVQHQQLHHQHLQQQQCQHQQHQQLLLNNNNTSTKTPVTNNRQEQASATKPDVLMQTSTKVPTTLNMNNKPTLLTIMHFNAQSITNKKQELGHFLATHKIHVCALNETWLVPKNTFKVHDYHVQARQTNQPARWRSHPHQKRHSSHIRTILEPRYRTSGCYLTPPSSSPQRIRPCGSDPPGQSVNNQAIVNFFASPKQAILVGVLNAHNQLWGSSYNNTAENTLKQLMENNHLLIINNDEPTYEPMHRAAYKATLDLAITKQATASKIINFFTTDELRSDHLTITFKIRACLQNRRQQTTTVEALNPNKLASELLSRCPTIYQINSTQELDIATSIITSAIQTA